MSFKHPWLADLLGLSLSFCTSAASAAVCPGPPMALQALAAGVWQIPGAAGDSDAGNHGAISNLLLVAQGPKTWLLGSGPSATYGRALACQIKTQLGRRITDVIAPWPRPELVLGQAGLPGVRRWAHAEVAQTMRERCPRCVQRLRLRLGTAADELGPTPIALPDRLLHGSHGQLGPWLWWRLQRAPGTPVTVWRLVNQPLWSAHGLLWADGAPDLRDADLGALQAATQTLQRLAAADGNRARWLPEQGPLQGANAPADHLRYWSALQSAVASAYARGDLETAPPAALPDLPAGMPLGMRHSLNWQHVWRVSEAQWLANDSAVPASANSTEVPASH
ncbi:MAG: hypothetical protein AB3X44_11725 [Leptothrix sp. (in: b-proteobacteria)]